MVIVQIKCGKIRGKVCQTECGQKFFSFQNIPYAAPPIGHLRFKAPQPPESWGGIRDATQEGNECLSRHMITKQIVGSEDCLILNVYTPQLPDRDHQPNLKPVMFWIHGGMFTTGSSKTEIFGPEFLLDEQQIVLVTINYRLGILGFLSLDDPTLGVPGNAAFKDMVMALRWVQTNIKQFCGDPNNVTVFGESAGAAAAHILMLSPMAKGLFHKIIAQSGTALYGYVFGRRSARLIAGKLGFYNTDDRKLLDFLHNVPATDILKAQTLVDADDFLEYKPRHFGAVVEHSLCKNEAFLSEDPIDIILSGNYNHVPLIMGYASAEGIIFDSLVRPSKRDIFIKDFELHVPRTLHIQKRTRKSIELAGRIKRFYFGDKEVDRKKQQKEFYQLVTDFAFFWPLYASIKYHLRIAKCPIYLYKMSIETDLNIFKKQSGVNLPGACHADDLGYLFKTIFTPEIQPNSVEELTRNRFVKMWTNFAHFSNPTPDSNDFPFIQWQPVERTKFHYLEIDKDLTLRTDPEIDRVWFLEEIFEKSTPSCKL